MQQFQSLKRLLIFYALTLLVMLSLYYVALYIGLKDNSKANSINAFEYLKHDLNEHITSWNYDVNKTLNKPYLQEFSYQIIFMLPSGQTYIYDHTRPNEKELNSVGFPATTLNTLNTYQLSNDDLRAVITLENGYQCYIVIRHHLTDVDWTLYRYWLPLMTAIMFFVIALLYMLRRQANWQQLLYYTDNLSEDAKEAYSSIPFATEKTTSEFLRLGYSLSRVKYQLHNNYRRIKKLQHRLERLVDSAPLPMMMMMRQGQISFFNQRFEQVFATSYRSDMNYTLTDFLIGSDKATQQSLLDLSSQRVTRTLLVYGLENNQLYQLHITPWFGEHGQVRGFTALLNNVNYFIKQTDALSIKNQNLETQVKSFTKLRSIIGHELRTPLNAIISTLDIIDKEGLTTEQHEILTILVQSSQSMLTMLNDMLDMAKIEAGRVDIVSESTDIFKLGQHASDLMLGNTRRQDIDLLYYFAPTCPRYISTDSSRLCQILLNFMDNAVKFTHSGYVALIVEGVTQQEVTALHLDHPSLLNSHTKSSIETQNLLLDSKATVGKATRSTKDTEYHWVRFSVKDSGIGIATMDQHKLFSYFNQANPQIHQEFGGTGLGLAISNSFAQLLGGFVHLESQIDCGSTFSLYIPCHDPIYQPVYHFHSDLLHIHLIAIVDQALRETYLQRIGHYLSMNISVYSELNPVTIAQLEQQLTDKNSKLTPILMLDYECYEAYNARNDHSSLQVESENAAAVLEQGCAEDERVDAAASIIQSIQEIIYNTDLPKILLSRKPERGIPSTILDEFDGFLNKPINITLMVSELIRLSQKNPAIIRTDKEIISPTKPNNQNNTRDYAISSKEQMSNNQTVKADVIDSNTSTLDTTETDITKPLILVVEDNAMNQKVAGKLLAKLGYRSIIAENGQKALTLLEANRQEISLILMDCRMPVMDGLETTQAIRDLGDDITIIALTANDAAEDRISCEKVGMDEFLTKPIQKDELHRILKHFIQS